MTSTTETANAAVAAAEADLATITAKRTATLLAIQTAEARRRSVALPAVLGDEAADATRRSAIADHVTASALLVDLDTAEAAARINLSAAQSAAVGAERETFRTALAVRLERVLLDHPELGTFESPTPICDDDGAITPVFLDKVEAAYRWLTGIPRSQEIDDKHYAVWWLEECAVTANRRGERGGSTCIPAFIAACWCHGDIRVEIGSPLYVTKFGLNRWQGLPAASVPLDGEEHAPVLHEKPRSEATVIQVQPSPRNW